VKLLPAWSAALALVVATALVAAPARAQSADELFAAGVEAMKREDWATACPAIARSYALEPLPGALFTLAECRARAGNIASAARDFGRYLEQVASLPEAERAKQQERVPEAERRRKQLDERVPRLTIAVPPDLPAGAIVTLDGTPLGADQLGVELPVDPAEHRVLLRVGALESDTLVTLAERERRRIQLSLPHEQPVAPAPAGAPVPPAPGPSAPGPSAPAQPPRATPSAEPREEPVGPSGLLVAGWVTVGVGAVGFGLAGTAGLLLLGKKDTIEANCTGTACNDAGFAEADDVPTLDALGTAGFVVGGVATAAGLVMVLLADEPVTATSSWRWLPSHHGADAGLTLERRW
jgi:hypothetical protein